MINSFEQKPETFLNLDDDHYLIEQVKEHQRMVNKMTRYNERDYEEIIKRYNYILYDLSVLLKKNIDNDIFLYNGVLSSIIWKGYLSNQKQFFYDGVSNDFMDLEGYLGLDILSGVGCCRHISGIFKDILNISGFQTNFVINNEYLTKADYLNLDFERYNLGGEPMTKSWDVSYIGETRSGGNHACIMFEYKGCYFIYDPTNIRIYSVKGFKGQLEYGIGKMNIFPTSLMIYNGYTNEQMNDYFENIRRSKHEITPYVELLHDGVAYVKDNKLLFDEFHFKINNDLEKIEEEKQKILVNKRG